MNVKMCQVLMFNLRSLVFTAFGVFSSFILSSNKLIFNSIHFRLYKYINNICD